MMWPAEHARSGPNDHPGHADRRRCRATEAAAALWPLRHPVLPHLHHRRRGHDRHGRAGRRRGLHLDDDLRGRLLRAAGPALRRARRRVPAGGRSLLLDPAGLRAPGRGGEQLPVLDHQPGMDRRHPRHLLHRRHRGVLQQRQHRAHGGVLCGGAAVRLDVHRRRHHLVQRGQVAAHGRRLRPFVLLGLFTLSVILYAAKRGAHGLGASSYSPSAGGFVLLVGVLLFNFVGFELPNSAGEEMTNPQRDVPFAIARSGVASVVLYALPVIGILIVLPTGAITNFSGFVSAIQSVFTVYGGHVAANGTATLSGAGLVLGDACALLFILCLLTSGATWIMGSDRALAVSCYDGSGPRVLGVINARFGTPVRVNVFSGVVASIVVILAQQITSGNAAKYFDAVLGVTISTTLISYLLIYPALWKLRRSHPDTPRPFKMPWH